MNNNTIIILKNIGCLCTTLLFYPGKLFFISLNYFILVNFNNSFTYYGTSILFYYKHSLDLYKLFELFIFTYNIKSFNYSSS